MQTLPKEYALLRKLSVCINELLLASNRAEIARLSDIYDYIKHKEEFREEFPTAVDFSRFMRRMHHRKVLTQFIRNCSVDTRIYHHYQWRFYPQDRIMRKETTPQDQNVAESHPDTCKFIARAKKHCASNGTGVRSKQELYIMNQLLAVEFFDVYYEKKLTANSRTRYPDFTVRNKITGTEFYWEHFGINNQVEYAEDMAEKIQWYRSIGHRCVDKGGDLIVTVYQDENQFVGLVQQMINRIKDN